MRKLLDFLIKPSLWFVFLVWVITLSLVSVTLVSLLVNITAFWIYFVYALSFVLLAYSVYLIVRYAKKIKVSLTSFTKRNKFLKKLFENYGYKTMTVSVISLTVNLAFALFNGVLGALNNSIWFFATSFYYLFLCLLRCFVFFMNLGINRKTNDEKQILIKKLKVFRFCGIGLLISEISLGAIVTLMVLENKPIIYEDITAIALAFFTFYKLTMAIINIFRAKKLQDPIVQAFRNVGLTDAGATLISLQVTLIAVFSTDDNVNPIKFNALTGFVVCILTVVWGIVMIINANKKINALTTENSFNSGEKN